jgi:hypothetical protein
MIGVFSSARHNASFQIAVSLHWSPSYVQQPAVGALTVPAPAPGNCRARRRPSPSVNRAR